MDKVPAMTGDNTLAQAIEHHQQGELTKAELAYLQLLEDQPDHPEVLHLLGVIAHQMGDSVTAVERVIQSLSIEPAHPAAWNNLGNIYAATERWDDAINSYQRAIDLNPDYANAHHNLGAALSHAQRENEATQSYRRAIELQPDATSHQCLAALQEKCGRFEDALVNYRQAIQYDPESVVAHSRLGAVLRKLDRLEEAHAVYRRWLQFDPENSVALHLSAACEPERAPARASDDYVRTTFDGFAEEFDACLAGLDYSGPQLVTTALERHLGKPLRRTLHVVDLGCGTGLCGGLLRSYAERLVGVDLSPGMLEKAAQRSLYDELVEAELTEFLAAREDDFDLLVAADTLIYLGLLEPVFVAARKALRNGGSFVFTVEKLLGHADSISHQLNRFGRYTHAEHGLRLGLGRSGFDLCHITEEVVRKEGDVPVIGLVVTAQKPS